MKKLLTLLTCLLFFAGTIHAAVTIRYYNKDSKNHTMEVKISGSTKKVEFGASRTASVTIQGGDDECIIKTSCGDIKVKSGDHVTIKNGCIYID